MNGDIASRLYRVPGSADRWVDGIPIAVDVSLPVLTAAGVLAVVLLMGVSAFFSSSEIAMFALSKHRLEALVEQGAANATVVQTLHEDPHRLLVTILVGNNVANVAMSSISTAVLGFYVTEAQAVLVATFGVTSLVLLFCESAPKSYAVEHTERWALAVARPLRLSGYLFAPFIVVFDRLTKAINSLLGTGTEIETAYLTRSELHELIVVGEREGAIETDERERLQRVFTLSEMTAREIMVPRPDVVAVPVTASLEGAIQTCVASRYTQLPIYDGTLDTVVGTVHICDLVRERDYGERDPGDVSLDTVVTPTVHVPETYPADEVLVEMQRAQVHLAVVIDEFGTTEGIVTTEDPTEVILGEILQPRETEPIRYVDETTALVQGEVPVTMVNELLEISLPEPASFDTIAGLVLEERGQLPEEGERLAFEDATIVVEDVSDSRIHSVRVIHDE